MDFVDVCKKGAAQLLLRAVEMMEQDGVCKCADLGRECALCTEMSELTEMAHGLQHSTKQGG